MAPKPGPGIPHGGQMAPRVTHRASRNRERRIMTASHVLCFSCIWMELNLRWMMLTMRSISFGEMGLVRLCSLRRFITWVVNSLHAWNGRTVNTGAWGGSGPGQSAAWAFLETRTRAENSASLWGFCHIRGNKINDWLRNTFHPV